MRVHAVPSTPLLLLLLKKKKVPSIPAPPPPPSCTAPNSISLASGFFLSVNRERGGGRSGQVRSVSGQCQVSVGQCRSVSGQCQVSVRSVSGQCQVQCQVSVRSVSGQFVRSGQVRSDDLCHMHVGSVVVYYTSASAFGPPRHAPSRSSCPLCA